MWLLNRCGDQPHRRGEMLFNAVDGTENVFAGEPDGNGLRHIGISAVWLANYKSPVFVGGSLHCESHEAAIQ
jgi:hypothetical protein